MAFRRRAEVPRFHIGFRWRLFIIKKTGMCKLFCSCSWAHGRDSAAQLGVFSFAKLALAIHAQCLEDRAMPVLTGAEVGKGRRRRFFAMDWLPSWPTFWRRPPRWRWTPSSPTRPVTPSTDEPSPKQFSDNGSSISIEPPLSLLARRRCLLVAVWLTVMCLLAAAALMSSRRSAATQGSTSTTSNNRVENSTESALTVSELPFLLDGGVNERAAVDAAQPRWVRVLSSKAAHPAMYVPADGMVYCPIAKASVVVAAEPAVNAGEFRVRAWFLRDPNPKRPPFWQRCCGYTGSIGTAAVCRRGIDTKSSFAATNTCVRRMSG